MLKPTTRLPPRTDEIKYAPAKHAKEFDTGIQWRDCPPQHRPIIEAIIKEYWDVYSKAGMKNPIRGFEFTIDTGHSAPICCKVPRYGPHESRVMTHLVKMLEDKGLVEDDEGPYGAIIVLASKPNQGHIHWTQFIFRLCISYRALNAFTRPFIFPVSRCDDSVEEISDREVTITHDLDSGYWQVLLHKQSREKTAFFTPEGKKHWCRMPMGIMNAHAFFVAMLIQFKHEWHGHYTAEGLQLIDRIIQLYKDLTPPEFQHMLKATIGRPSSDIHATGDPGSAVIVDNIIMYAKCVVSLLAYYLSILKTLKFYRVTANLRKGRYFPTRAEFVGTDVLATGNAPAESKYHAIEKLTRPILFTDLRMLIGMLGFYQKWLPLYETRIIPWRDYQKAKPIAGSGSKPEEAKILQALWQDTDDQLMGALKSELLEGPVLKRPNWNRRFYLKTDWSKEAMAAVVLQPDCDAQAEGGITRELEGGKCEFDLTLSGLRLRPIAFYSRRCTGTEKDYHSYVSEAATGRWAMFKCS